MLRIPLRKNLKTNSLFGYPRARNLRETLNRLLHSHHTLRLLINRIPSVIKLMCLQTLRLTKVMRVAPAEEAETSSRVVPVDNNHRMVLLEITSNKGDLLNKMRALIFLKMS